MATMRSDPDWVAQVLQEAIEKRLEDILEDEAAAIAERVTDILRGEIAKIALNVASNYDVMMQRDDVIIRVRTTDAEA